MSAPSPRPRGNVSSHTVRRPYLKALGEGAAILLISLLAVRLFVRVPYHMTVYSMYCNLAWLYYPLNGMEPLSRLWDLALFPDFKFLMPAAAPHWMTALWDSIPLVDAYLPLRADVWIGSLQSLIYLPLFLLWPSPDSVRFLGLLFLALQALLIRRITGGDTLLIFAMLLAFMPYSFQHIIDVSMVAYQLTCLYIVVWLVTAWGRRAAREGRLHWRYPLGAGAATFLGIWFKLSFLFYLPAIALFVLRAAVALRPLLARPAGRRRFIAQCALMALAAGAPSAALLDAQPRVGTARHMIYYGISESCVRIGLEEGGFRYTPLGHLISISRYLTNPLRTAQDIYVTDVVATPSGVAALAAAALLFPYGAVRIRRRGGGLGFLAVNAIALSFTTIAIVSHPAAAAMRHVILAYPFGILALFSIRAELSGDRVVTALFALLAALGLWHYHSLSGMGWDEWKRRHGTGYALVPNFTCLQEALDPHSGRYVFVHADWGTYNIKALYGPRDQCNVAAWPLDSMGTVLKVREICGRTGRRPMIIRMKENSSSDIHFLRRHFPGLVRLRMDCDADPWEIWYQPWPRSRRYLYRG